jgi:uncharacterized delta-60 repeat protein
VPSFRIGALTIQPDDSILLGGYQRLPYGSDEFEVARYTPDGQIDTTFGNVWGSSHTGYVTTLIDLGGGPLYADGTCMTLDASGNILLGGSAWSGGDGVSDDFLVARYTPAGLLDRNFGAPSQGRRLGYAAVDFSTADSIQPNDYCHGIGALSSGQIVLAGESVSSVLGTDFAIAQFTADGTPDSGFGNNGQLLTGIGSAGGSAMGVAILPDDRIIAVGTSGYNYSFGDFGLGSFLKDNKVTIVAAVDNLTASANPNGHIDLSWTVNYPGATSVEVEQSTDGITFTPVATLSGDAASYTDSGLPPGTHYWYQIRLIVPGGAAFVSAPADTWTLASTPTLVSVSAAGPNDADLTWTGGDGAFRFVVQRSDDGAPFAPIDTTDSLSYQDLSAPDGKELNYEVIAIDPGGQSLPSNAVSTRTPLSVPTDVSAAASGQDIQVSWTNNSTSADGFVIERSSDGQSFSALSSVGTEAYGEFTDTAAAPDTTYYYRVRATRDTRQSNPSDSALASTDPVQPIVSVTGSGSATAGATTAINVSATLPPNAPSADQVSSYDVDWGDGQSSSGDGSTTSYNHAFSAAGTYTVNVTATCAAGTASASMIIKVTAASTNVGNVTFPGYDPDHVPFITEGTSYPVNPTYSGAGNLIAWVIDFGDGTDDQQFSPGDSINHTYEHGLRDSGVLYVIHATAVTDIGMASASRSVKVTSNYQPDPDRDLQVTSRPGSGGTYGGLLIFWPCNIPRSVLHVDWGDGTSTDFPVDDPSGGTTSDGHPEVTPPDHQYPEEGTYYVTATSNGATGYGFDSGGDDESTSPTMSNIANQTVMAGSAINISASVSGFGTQDITETYVNWGDGTGLHYVGSGAATAHLDHVPAGTLSASLSVYEAEAGDVASKTFTIQSNLDLKFTAYRAGPAQGDAISTDVVAQHDPTQDVLLTDDNFDDQLPNGQPDNAGQTVTAPSGSSGDPDLERITLKQVADLTDGVLTLSISDPSAVRLFQSDGSLLFSSDRSAKSALQLNFSHPSGYLSSLTSGDVSLWVQGMKVSRDLTFTLRYSNAVGTVSSDALHMDVAKVEMIGKSGDVITSVPAVPAWQPAFLAQEIADTPPIPAAAYFKIRIEGLPADAAASLQVTSSSVPSDFFMDEADPESSDYQSKDWAVIYQADPSFVLTDEDKQAIKDNLDLNVVHNQAAPRVSVGTKPASAPATAPATGGGIMLGPKPMLSPLTTSGETATATSASGVNLTWSGGVGATSLVIEQLNDAGLKWFPIKTVPGSTTTATVTVAGGSGTVASFRIVAENAASALIGKPFRVMTTFSATDANLSLKNVVFSAMVTAERTHASFTYYLTAGVDGAFNQEFAVMNDVHYAVKKLPAGSTAQFASNKLVGDTGEFRLGAATPPPTADDCIHELAHALDAKFWWHPTSYDDKESFAYSLERTLAGAATGFVCLAKMDTSPFAAPGSMPRAWSFSWKLLDATVVGTNAPVGNSVNLITSAQVTDMQKDLGLGFSESGLKLAYQRMLLLRGATAAAVAALAPPVGLSPCFR